MTANYPGESFYSMHREGTCLCSGPRRGRGIWWNNLMEIYEKNMVQDVCNTATSSKENFSFKHLSDADLDTVYIVL